MCCVLGAWKGDSGLSLPSVSQEQGRTSAGLTCERGDGWLQGAMWGPWAGGEGVDLPWRSPPWKGPPRGKEEAGECEATTALVGGAALNWTPGGSCQGCVTPHSHRNFVGPEG